MLYNYDELIRDDPTIQRLLAQSLAEGKTQGVIEGEARGKIEELKDSIAHFLSIRFSPALAAQAQPIITTTQSYDALKLLFRQLLQAPDEQSIQLILDLSNERSHLDSSSLPTE